MSVGRGLWGGAAVALMASACGGGAAATAGGERCGATERSAELRVQLRHERHTIRSLQNEVSLLRAQLRDVPAGARTSEPLAPPPAPAADASTGPSAGVAGEPLPQQVVESIYGDVEVVYEGEAAKHSVIRPRIELHESSRTAEGLDSADEEPAQPVAIPDVGAERLPVMRGKIPTVDEQLRRARAGSDQTAAPIVPAGEITAQTTAPTASAAVPVQPAVTEAAPAAEAAPAPPADPGDPIGDYRRAAAALKKGNHQQAVSLLRAFIGRFPDHYLADNVQYFVAESHFRRELYKVALSEYEKVVERYWRGNKLPGALLKIGLCYVALGKPEAAQAALRRLVARFPRTKSGKLARARLQELEQK